MKIIYGNYECGEGHWYVRDEAAHVSLGYAWVSLNGLRTFSTLLRVSERKYSTMGRRGKLKRAAPKKPTIGNNAKTEGDSVMATETQKEQMIKPMTDEQTYEPGYPGTLTHTHTLQAQHHLREYRGNQ